MERRDTSERLAHDCPDRGRAKRLRVEESIAREEAGRSSRTFRIGSDRMMPVRYADIVWTGYNPFHGRFGASISPVCALLTATHSISSFPPLTRA